MDISVWFFSTDQSAEEQESKDSSEVVLFIKAI
jgi:hypothetical protein